LLIQDFALMRTTLTIDPDVAERIRQETQSGRRSLKAVINDRLRMGYGLVTKEVRTPYRVRPHSSAFQPGVDPAKLNQLIDELDARESIARARSAAEP